MGTHIAEHVPLPGHDKIGHPWKLWIAATGIVALTAIGFYLAISQWRTGYDVEFGLILLGCFVGPAIAAAFGYLWCLPEALGGDSRDQGRTLSQKWSDYALLCSFVGILVITDFGTTSGTYSA